MATKEKYDAAENGLSAKCTTGQSNKGKTYSIQSVMLKKLIATKPRINSCEMNHVKLHVVYSIPAKLNKPFFSIFVDWIQRMSSTQHCKSVNHRVFKTYTCNWLRAKKITKILRAKIANQQSRTEHFAQPGKCS